MLTVFYNLHKYAAQESLNVEDVVKNSLAQGVVTSKRYLQTAATAGFGFGYSVAITSGRAVVRGLRCCNNNLNPVTLTLRYGPSVIRIPLKYITEEVQGASNYLLSPKESMIEVMAYFAKKPIRLARLFHALGLPIDSEVLRVLKAERDLERAEKLKPMILKGGLKGSKVLTASAEKSVEKARMNIILSLAKALCEGGEGLPEDIEKLVFKLLGSSAERILAKTVAKYDLLPC
ncbi:hypothetical protein ACH42_04155 [Endozoicomonas sp. (ex Bugula neritina AB1)]|nr:hypothetical protein ACH42_04155 [Endozoicomonas sp. (ex Bugula neritina AB1)]